MPLPDPFGRPPEGGATRSSSVRIAATSSRPTSSTGFVYTSDATVRRAQVREAFRPGKETYWPVIYPVAVVAGTKHSALPSRPIMVILIALGVSVLGFLGYALIVGPAVLD